LPDFVKLLELLKVSDSQALFGPFWRKLSDFCQKLLVALTINLKWQIYRYAKKKQSACRTTSRWSRRRRRRRRGTSRRWTTLRSGCRWNLLETSWRPDLQQ